MEHSARSPEENEALRLFMRRVWCEDVQPLLQGARAAERRTAARVTGKAAAAAGLFVDGVFGLKGKPFTRFATVVGASLGAMLPDVWDWEWFRESATTEQRDAVASQVKRRAAELPEADALALFELAPSATREELKHAWREIARSWHPDRASHDAQREEFRLRFVAFNAAYERLESAYEKGTLPIKE